MKYQYLTICLTLNVMIMGNALVFYQFVLGFLNSNGPCCTKESLLAAIRKKFPQLNNDEIDYLLSKMVNKGLIRWKSINNVEYICLPPQEISDLSNEENESINDIVE